MLKNRSPPSQLHAGILKALAAECSSCKDGYYLNANLTCSPCSHFGEACVSCDPTGCLDCYSSLHPDLSGMCSTCGARLEHCRLCSEEDGSCLLCEPSYELQNDGTCAYSMYNTNRWACLDYSGPDYCVYCRRGYRAVDGNCVRELRGCRGYYADGSCSQCSNSRCLWGGKCWS